MTADRPGGEGPLLDGRYRLGERLGGGGVADVYRAFDERLARPVAIKVFRGDAASQLQRHEAEMRTLAQLDHPALVAVFDAGTDHERPYLVMQLVEGTTLADELRDGPLPADRVAAYGASLADALAYVHAQGFVHRDVKPANVLVSEDGRVRLADFGIARLVDSAHVTATGEVLGTPAYFAPEQVAGEPVGPAADVYALGLVLLECLTGERAFTGTTMEVAMARLGRDPTVPEALPLPWRSLLGWMTARRPGDRPSADEVGASLRQISAGAPLDESTVAIRRPVPPPRDETMVMPATQAFTQTTPVAAAPAGAEPRVRRRISPWVVGLVILVAAAIGVVVAMAVSGNNGSGTSSTFTPGKPTVQQPVLEDDVQRLERLVQP